MDNLFIARHFDWARKETPRVRFVNALLARSRFGARLVSAGSGDMSSVEERINIYHLVSQLLAFDVPGAFVECGCLEGESVALLQMILDMHEADRTVHAFDAFVDPPADRLRGHFQRLGLKLPVLHPGLLADTLHELPEQIGFAHADLGPVPWVQQGPGASRAGLHEALDLFLEHVYPRVVPRGIILLQDYHPLGLDKVYDVNPEVRAVTDRFFADKPEKIITLYGGQYSHAYVRKA